MPPTQPKSNAMIGDIIIRLFVPIIAGVIAMFVLQSSPALLIGLIIGVMINLLFTKAKRHYATYLQFVWFVSLLGYYGVLIPGLNKTTPTGLLGTALGLALLSACTGVWFYRTRTRRLDTSNAQDNLFRFLPIVLFVVILIGGIIRLPITTINGVGWNSGGGVIIWVIFSVLLALITSMCLAGIFQTVVFTWRGLRETLGFVYLPILGKEDPPATKYHYDPDSQFKEIKYDPNARQREKEQQEEAQRAADDAQFNERMKEMAQDWSNDRPTSGWGSEF